MRKKETYKPQNTFQSHPVSSSSKEEEEEDKNMTTRRRQQQEDNNEKTFNPTSDGSSQRTHSSVVSRGVRVCVKKNSRFFSHKSKHTHTHTLKTLNIFLRVQKPPLFLFYQSALLFYIAKERD